ncbi:MAG: hypothetical protein KBD23_00625 [Gammaproteobacteria bacterium]|nr:hypothetical protein [Gammaproteobacteria bacterium]
MEPRDRAAKRLKFAPGTDSGNRLFTPLAQSRKQPKKQDMNKLISGVWVRLSQTGQYEHLREKLDEFGLQGEKMSNFFNKEGPFLLRCGLIRWDNPESLRFICDHVPTDLLKSVLRKDGYSSVETFLLAHSGLEKHGLLSQNGLSERNEKLRLLFGVDHEGLASYMESESFENKFSQGVKQSFREAEQLHKQSLFSVSMKC